MNLSTNTNNNSLSAHKIVFLIFSLWVIYLLVLGLLQLFGLQLGFAVWPLGEDRNWLGFMQDAPGIQMAHLFWKADDRNPLAPWWWLAAYPFIFKTDWGLYLVRKCVDPFLASVVFLLLDRLGRQQYRTFAFSVALIVLMWNFSAYFEQITWSILVALGFNLLSIFFYCRFLDNQRATGHDLALALLCYLIAIATYTLQSGAIIAVGLLALFRGNSFKQNIKTRFWEATRDTSFFLIIFLIYCSIWYTVSEHIAHISNWADFFKQSSASLRQFIFHPSYVLLMKLTRTDWSAEIISLIFVIAFSMLYFIFSKFSANKIINANIKIPTGWIVTILLAIALPTLIVESGNTIWLPGTRSVMIQQVWQPLLYVSIIFLLANVLPIKNPKRKQQLVLLAVAVLGAIVVVIGLNYNHRLVIRTQYQKALAQGLKQLHIPAGVSPSFLVKTTIPNLDVDTIPFTISNYGQSILNQDKVLLRPLKAKLPNFAGVHFWTITFGPDNKGVINAGPFGDENPIPYKNIWIVFFDGKKVWVPDVIDKKDFEGLQVDWKRNSPIKQAKKVI